MQKNKKKYEWYGVDLDGTLAEYHGHKGLTVIGKPVPRMLERVKKWLSEGKNVRILTARVGPTALAIDNKSKAMVIKAIQEWCLEHIGQTLMVTSEKDYGMREIWDDRAIGVEKNTGESYPKNLLKPTKNLFKKNNS